MSLKEETWTCECGTHLRYANTHRKEIHFESKKHKQFLLHNTVFVERYTQRTRKPDPIVISHKDKNENNEKHTSG